MRKPILAITMGDPGGIGPEVIAKTFRRFKKPRDLFYLLIGTPPPFEFLKREKGINFPLHTVPSLHVSSFRDDAVNFLDISGETTRLKNSKNVFDIGKVSAVNAAMAYGALKAAAEAAVLGQVEGLVTAPVNKTAIRLIDPKFNGHTDYLAEVAHTKKVAMMFVSKRLKVTLVTIHVPLKKVSSLLTEDLIFNKIRLTDKFLRTHFNLKKPRLAVCALNPHGKETGEEDEAVILPAVRRALREKIEVTGPLSADQLFFDAYEGRYDAVVSMYHDQGLAPFKMIAFRDGVNVTLGLPFVRTSPDHGTAFDIAYQGKADPSSMQAAVELAESLVLR